MLRLTRSNQRWWNKPLVSCGGSKPLPAELVILRSLLQPQEEGAWMNSRNRTSGVIDLDWTRGGKTRTVRRQLPEFVSRALDEIYRDAQLARGCPDLVIWNPNTSTVRLVEIKCPHWD